MISVGVQEYVGLFYFFQISKNTTYYVFETTCQKVTNSRSRKIM